MWSIPLPPLKLAFLLLSGYIRYSFIGPIKLLNSALSHIYTLKCILPLGVGVLLAGLDVYPGVVVLPGIPPPLAFK